jgi:ribosomal protein S27E
MNTNKLILDEFSDLYPDDEEFHQIPTNVLKGRGEDGSQEFTSVYKCEECDSHHFFYDGHRNEVSCIECGLVCSRKLNDMI